MSVPSVTPTVTVIPVLPSRLARPFLFVLATIFDPVVKISVVFLVRLFSVPPLTIIGRIRAERRLCLRLFLLAEQQRLGKALPKSIAVIAALQLELLQELLPLHLELLHRV